MERHPQIDAGSGHFFETGLAVANARMAPYLLEPRRFRDGLRRVRQAVHHGGHTTIADMAFALFDQDREWEALCDVLDRDDTPFRFHWLQDIPWPRFDAPATRTVLRRYVTERVQHRFGVYVGGTETGQFAARSSELAPLCLARTVGCRTGGRAARAFGRGLRRVPA